MPLVSLPNNHPQIDPMYINNGHTPKDFAMNGFLETGEGIASILLEDWPPILELFNNFYVMLIPQLSQQLFHELAHGPQG